MNLLIIGGTVFLGRQFVLSALEAGHKVTTLNRGNHNLAEQSGVERLIGDRNIIEILANRTWDAVIDTCGMEPEVVAKSAEFLKDSVGKYIFISSISAFDNFREIEMDERAPARLLPADAQQDYGSRKAHCEKIVTDIYGKRCLIIRPGLICGRWDPTDRFTYWPHRILQGGKALAPGRPDRPIQFIDVRDISEWVLRLAGVDIYGIFNTTGPGYTYTMKQLLKECVELSESQTELVWVPDEKLVEAKVTPWSELPLWIPESDGDFAGFMQIDCTRAQNTGLSYRRPGETVAEVIRWLSEEKRPTPLKAGIDPEKEKKLLSGFVKV
jgi:2'-hydroxyisoflavone reductase